MRTVFGSTTEKPHTNQYAHHHNREDHKVPWNRELTESLARGGKNALVRRAVTRRRFYVSRTPGPILAKAVVLLV